MYHRGSLGAQTNSANLRTNQSDLSNTVQFKTQYEIIISGIGRYGGHIFLRAKGGHHIASRLMDARRSELEITRRATQCSISDN